MTTENNALTLMSANVNIGIDEVVSVFVSRYETDLFTKKDEISSQIKSLKGNLENMTKRLIGSVDKSVYEEKIRVLNISSKVTNVLVDFDSKSGPAIVVTIEVKDEDKNENYTKSFIKNVRLSFSQVDVDLHAHIKSELEGLNTELLEVMNLIKSVSRKERQIRGRISEMKLEQSGYGDLLKNQDMLQLVNIK